MNYLIILTFFEFIFASPSCKNGEKLCSKCDTITNLCFKCQNKEVLIPDDDGGCFGSKICEEGINYCEKCNEEKDLCINCINGYYPDSNGGCSYIGNCEISYLGECLLCKNGFILFGKSDSFKICKSFDSEDFKNCKDINYSSGNCQTCENGYYLNDGDKKCSETENCYLSVYGKCRECINNYYLDHKDDRKCKSTKLNQTFLYCKETEDGEKCSKCIENYFLTRDGKCIKTNYCSKPKGLYCEKCQSGYYLTKDGKSCVKTENCNDGEPDIGICNSCLNHFYLDLNDGSCKSNIEDDDLKYCKIYGDKCLSCDYNYYLGEDGKCSNSKFCSVSEYGKCKKCINNYLLGLDDICTNIEHCIYSDSYFNCGECEEGYYFVPSINKCENKNTELLNCKITESYINSKCYECKDNYYLSAEDSLCYSNKEDDLFYKCAKSNSNGTECLKCHKNFYLGIKDKKCSPIENCAVSKDEKCVECGEKFCLNVKTGKCEYNYFIYDKEHIMYYHCLKTNKEATECEICLPNYKLGKNGFCMNTFNCEEEEEGICIKCPKEEFPMSYCLNSHFGCINKIYDQYCLRCDNDMNLDSCTECIEGYELTESIVNEGKYSCVKIEDK